jgi:trimethylamine--corrinoid protein Co-methyltransferase
VVIGASSGDNVKKTVKMAAAIAGGMDNLRKRPIYTPVCCPNSPLSLNPDTSDVIVEAARAGVPINVLSMALAGGTSPVTLAGTLVTHNAEVLAGLVLSQLVRKWNSFIYGSSTTMMDMRYTTAAVGAPELGMLNAGVAMLAQYYLLPSWVAGG